jgi:hypothetical protein
MKKIYCDICKRELIHGEPFQQFSFPSILKDGKIKEFYAQSDICSECIIKIANFFKITIKRELEEISPSRKE